MQNRNNKRIPSKSKQHYKQINNRDIWLQAFGFENLDPVSHPGEEERIIQFKNCQLFIALAVFAETASHKPIAASTLSSRNNSQGYLHTVPRLLECILFRVFLPANSRTTFSHTMERKKEKIIFSPGFQFSRVSITVLLFFSF